MRKRVSLCMIVKNEEANLPRCLGPLANGLFDEWIVVDTGSTDRTKEVALGMGAKVFDFPWCDNFAAARNECLRHATSEWVFTYDADDYFDEANLGKLRALLANLPDGEAAYNMIRHCPPGPDGAGESSVEMLRLWRNHPQTRWIYHCHEQILPALVQRGTTIYSTDIVIHHHGYQDPDMLRRKLERNLKLLRAANADYPDDPFMLYYLGRTSLAFERTDEALPLLRRSLELAPPGAPFLRKLYGQLARGHHQKGQRDEALAFCEKGRALFADDAELLFLASMLRSEKGDLKGAETALLELLRPGARFVHEDASLSGFKARQNLGVIYQRQGRHADAETQFRAVLAEQPNFMPAWLALGNVYLEQGRWPDLEPVIQSVEKDARRLADAALLRARAHAARKEYAAARAILERLVAQVPKAVEPRLALSRVLLQEARESGAAAETALNAVLELDPRNAEAKANLQALRGK
jgi:glycosyltransferase involved in cell wall biosynthesis